jgi:hypothetical protein
MLSSAKEERNFSHYTGKREKERARASGAFMTIAFYGFYSFLTHIFFM